MSDTTQERKPQPGDGNWPEPTEFTPSGKPKWNNGELPAGADMYFYCKVCGEQCDQLPETYDPHQCRPKEFCDAHAAKSDTPAPEG